jgi:hypothetical protein
VIRKILAALLVIFVIIQFIRPARNSGLANTASDIRHFVKVPDSVFRILEVSCYDCHSNHTEYPWYTNVQPVGLWLRNHINGGKKEINFSDLSGMNNKKMDRKLKDIADQVLSGDMPMESYTIIHRYAKLDSAQIYMIKNWTDSARKELGYRPAY